jgi:hypothetical protein
MTKLVIPNSTLCPGVPSVYLTHTAPLSAWMSIPYNVFSALNS